MSNKKNTKTKNKKKSPKKNNLIKNLGKLDSKQLSYVFIGAAVIVFVVGVVASTIQWHTNQVNNKKAATLVYDANHNINHLVPATIKPTESAFDTYTAAPNLPRYIFIPSIGVKAIVGAVGLTTGGQIGTPDNVFNTDWYNGSSEPGQPGAMVIDGHVSSWTTNGVFYDLKNLVAGDEIQIEKGNDTIITYKVVTKQIYSYQNVNMSAVLSPINPAKPGLNLITCTGDIIAGTNEFNQRVVVFASEI